MNKHLILISLLIIPLLGSAQDEEFKTIFQKKGEKIKISGFAAPIMNFTAIDNEFALMMGGGCAVSLNNVFIGGYGVGKTNEIAYKESEDNTTDDYYLGMGHGGLWFGYVIRPKNAIHLSLSSQVGWGAITKKQKLSQDEVENIKSQSFTIISPIVEVEYNIAKYFKIGTGASWSYVTGTADYSSSKLSKPSFFLSFKFGWFD
jgi:hypothetical protein